MTIETGQIMDDFTAPMTSDATFKLSEQRGKNIIIYFYPKDNTPGCTQEGQGFRDNYQKFTDRNFVIFGVSRDSIKSHENFKAKHEFPFELISDKDEVVCKLFDVIKEKKMYGKTHMGIERSTFIIDAEGKLIKEWRKVKVKTHIEEVLDFINSL